MSTSTIKRREKIFLTEDDVQDIGLDGIVSFIEDELANPRQCGEFIVVVDSISIQIGNNQEIPYQNKQDFTERCRSLLH